MGQLNLMFIVYTQIIFIYERDKCANYWVDWLILNLPVCAVSQLTDFAVAKYFDCDHQWPGKWISDTDTPCGSQLFCLKHSR